MHCRAKIGGIQAKGRNIYKIKKNKKMGIGWANKKRLGRKLRKRSLNKGSKRGTKKK